MVLVSLSARVAKVGTVASVDEDSTVATVDKVATVTTVALVDIADMIHLDTKVIYYPQWLNWLYWMMLFSLVAVVVVEASSKSRWLSLNTLDYSQCILTSNQS